MVAKVCKGVPSVLDGDNSVPREQQAHGFHWIFVISEGFNSKAAWRILSAHYFKGSNVDYWGMWFVMCIDYVISFAYVIWYYPVCDILLDCIDETVKTRVLK